MSKIYVSFDSSEGGWLDDLFNILRSHGHEMMSQRDVAAGERIDEGTAKLIERSEIFIPFVSPKYDTSGSIHAREISYAIERKHAGEMQILPVAVDMNMDLIPSPLNEFTPVSVNRSPISEAASTILDAITATINNHLDKIIQLNLRHKRLKEGAAGFIKQSKADLRERESQYRRVAYLCYSIGILALSLGIFFARQRLVTIKTNDTPTTIVSHGLVYALLITLLIALVKYVFTIGKSYMNEALKNADRTHAISFGEFYITAYPERARWEEIKEAFQNWNIDQGSSFKTQETKEFDPRVLEQAIELAKAIVAAKDEKK